MIQWMKALILICALTCVVGAPFVVDDDSDIETSGFFEKIGNFFKSIFNFFKYFSNNVGTETTTTPGRSNNNHQTEDGLENTETNGTDVCILPSMAPSGRSKRMLQPPPVPCTCMLRGRVGLGPCAQGPQGALVSLAILAQKDFPGAANKADFILRQADITFDGWKDPARTAIFVKGQYICKQHLKELGSDELAAGGLILQYPELDQMLKDYADGEEVAGYGVSYPDIRVEALRLMRELNIPGNEKDISRGMIASFFHRHDLTPQLFRRAVQDPKVRARLAAEFLIEARRETKGYAAQSIFNMDETPIYIPQNNDTKRREGTVVLTVSMDGRLLRTMIILRNETQVNGLDLTGKRPRDIRVRAHKDGHGAMNTLLFKDWVDSCFMEQGPYPPEKGRLLFLDHAKPHVTPASPAYLRGSANTEVKLIPKGLTDVLQPLDVYLIGPFREVLNSQLDEWAKRPRQPQTPWRDISYQEIIEIVLNALEPLREDTERIKQSFILSGLDADGKEVEEDQMNEGLRALLDLNVPEGGGGGAVGGGGDGESQRKKPRDS